MIIFVDKPSWFTSISVVNKLKRLWISRKIWFAGTLDPLATGLLIVWTDKDTKKLNYFLKLPKTYIAWIDLSKISDTWDIDCWDYIQEYKFDKKYIYIDWKKQPIPTKNQIEELLKKLTKIENFPLPSFSAKKLNWKRLYELARNWKQINIQKKMKVYNYKLISYNFPLIEIEFTVSTWTYIRSIWYWIWKQLWTWWILYYLRRTKIWRYKI